MNSGLAKALSFPAIVAALGLLAWVIYDIYQRDFWRPPAPQSASNGTSTNSSSPKVVGDINQIVAAHLFGRAEQKKVEKPKVVAAPKTRLNLKLIGVIASDTEGSSRALIQATGNKQDVVRVGEKIAKTDATLHSVEAGRVLISRKGVLESLEMERVSLAALDKGGTPQTNTNRGSSTSIRSNNNSTIALPEPTPPLPTPAPNPIPQPQAIPPSPAVPNAPPPNPTGETVQPSRAAAPPQAPPPIPTPPSPTTNTGQAIQFKDPFKN